VGVTLHDPGFEEWLAGERARLREVAIGALGRLTAEIKGPEAIALGKRLLTLDPLREASHRALMQAYAAAGEKALALKHYGQCCEMLKAELGVGPARETEELRQRLLQEGEPPTAAAHERPHANAGKPKAISIAVLPFTNMSRDADQEYFSDGITEDIITELSRFPNLFVIARNSSFAYKGKAVAISPIARELGVQCVLEGSVRRAGLRLRVTAQLIDATTGSHIWAERYDRELIDVFSIQDDISLSIVGAIAVELEDRTLLRARQKPPESLDAYDHWLRGNRLIYLTGQHNLEARKHFQIAATLDPSFSRAHSGLALTYQVEALDFPLPEDFQIAFRKSFEAAQTASTLDSANHQAHLALAYVFLYRQDCDQAAKHIARAMTLQPSDGDVLAHAGYIWSMIGDTEGAIRCAEKALLVNPHHPDWYIVFRATGLFTARRYAESYAFRSRAPEAFIDSIFFLAATLAYMERMDEARRRAQRAIEKLATTPGGALAIANGHVVKAVIANNPYCHREDEEHFAEGMRKAGIPG
jgi:TolB-like protein/Tfp pilus assembly protein PilF